MPTNIQDVARRAGVSIATVSRVLNRGSHPVRAVLRERVEAAARELNFRPSSLARGLAGRETRTLALILPDIANPYYPRLLRGVEDVASAHDYALIVCNTDYQPEKLAFYLQVLREKRVDGLLLAGGGHEGPIDSPRALAELAAAPFPRQVVGRHPLIAPSVRIDNVAGGRSATEHLIARGRRRIAFVGGPSDHTTVADRRRGYRQALRSAALDPSPTLEVAAGFGPADGAQSARRLLGLRRQPDGLFAANDHLAIGAIWALLEAGWRVPEDIAVIGFDDIPLATFFRPSLSSVAVPAYELGVAATERLLRQLSGVNVPETVWLATSVVGRQSSG